VRAASFMEVAKALPCHGLRVRSEWTVQPQSPKRSPRDATTAGYLRRAPGAVSAALAAGAGWIRSRVGARSRGVGRGSVRAQADDDPMAAKVFFCILARGSCSKDAWPKSPRGAAAIGNTRDDIARCLMAALTGKISNDTAVVLIFEDTDNTQSKYWWVACRVFRFSRQLWLAACSCSFWFYDLHGPILCSP
ncbi:unnamed protein product, partial [Effrenium voratum]